MRVSLAVLVATLLPAVTFAKVPDPRFSIADPIVFGDTQGTRTYRVELRDVSNAPLSGEEVVLDFSATNVHLDPVQEAGTTVDCAARTLSRLSSNAGVAEFHPRFGGGCTGADVLVSAEGMWLRHVPSRSADLDGLDACTGMNDLSIFAEVYEQDAPGMDLDGSGGRIGLGDFSILTGAFVSGIKGSYCP